MAVSTTNGFDGPYAANGVTTSFPFTFTAPSAGEVSVLLRDADGVESVASPSLYTVTLGSVSGGTVTFTTAPATGYSVIPYLNPAFTQNIRFEDGSAWRASPVNEGYDRSAARDQALKRDINRAMLSPLGEAGVSLPATATRQGKFLAFDASGVPIAASGVGTDAAMRTDLAASGGSALTGFLQAGTGAVPRTAQAKMRDVVSAADFGASPSATATANVTAFQAALNTGRSVFIPGGTYSLNAKLTSTGKAVSIITDDAVILKWNAGIGTNQGFDFTFSNLTTHTLSIGDIELVTECEGGGTAIKAVWPDGASGFNRLWQLGKIRMRGSDIVGQVGYWDYGLDTTNGWLGFGEALDFYGKGSGVTPLSTAAWVARGKSTDSRVHIRARYAKSMLLIAGFSEGLDISGSFAVACDYAVDCTGTTGLNTPGFVWIGGHAACFKGGIRSVNILQGNVSNILFYKRNDSAQNFIGFDLDSASTEWQISDCKVFSLANPGGGTTTAIRDAGANNITTNLRTITCDTDVNVVSGASGFAHTFSRSDNTRGAITQGDTDGQVICLPGGSLGSTTSYFDTLAANSATPSILGYRKWGSCGHFLTANTVATTITDFTGGFPGDEFVLQANDANTTVQHNAGIQLNGGVNKVLASAETIRLRRVTSTAWKQI